jgi:nucleoside-specific outer membrane channel protein Tsx
MAYYVLATWHRIIRLCYAPVETKVLERPMGKQQWYKGCINQVWDTSLTPTTASSLCGSMDTYECINADADIDFNTDLYKYFNTARFPVDAFQYLDSYNVRFFTWMDMPR